MHTNIISQPLKKQDYKSICNIIIKIWNLDEYFSEKTAHIISNLYLHTCLSENIPAHTITYNGHLVGIVFENSLRKHKSAIFHTLQKHFYYLRLQFNAEKKNIFKVLKNIENINAELLTNCPSIYNEEDLFLALYPDSKKYNINKNIFNEILKYIKKQNIEHFFIYTDTRYNCQFYDYMQMKKCSEKTVLFNYDEEDYDEITFFIYEYKAI
ncbi:hypothetical protein KQI69_00405 [Eubacterium sp. MSJ-13]|uniref:hypothetical protein n=1 Tax=Eubacterium sp. MSJ-13 TaxID=2841513 RepID=UPI001C106812|nr:hypothetical protein [Eubacterium sp. MSJ-13]MBU5477661.1 hypothetical protein [Eubacterium sp. MSJ-13]